MNIIALNTQGNALYHFHHPQNIQNSHPTKYHQETIETTHLTFPIRSTTRLLHRTHKRVQLFLHLLKIDLGLHLEVDRHFLVKDDVELKNGQIAQIFF